MAQDDPPDPPPLRPSTAWCFFGSQTSFVALGTGALRCPAGAPNLFQGIGAARCSDAQFTPCNKIQYLSTAKQNSKQPPSIAST
jgi:hypothetical protein